MAVDPFCGMEIDEKDASIRVNTRAKHIFLAPGCACWILKKTGKIFGQIKRKTRKQRTTAIWPC